MLTSIWIGYGCIVDPSLWSTPFEEWFTCKCPFRGVSFEFDNTVIMIALATTTKIHAEYLGIVELPYDTVFAFDEVTQCIPQERIDWARQQWEQFLEDVCAAGYTLPAGRLLFAHTCD